MLDIPFVDNSGMACALSCYTMTSKYFFPDSTFVQIAEISAWHSGYVVWGFKFWLWIMDRGIKITEYDPVDIKKWADNGLSGLKSMVSEAEFDFYIKNTKDIDSYSDDILKVLEHPNFTFKNRKPSFDDLENAVKNNFVCEVLLDAGVLNGKSNLSLHRVSVLGIESGSVFFNDPSSKKPQPSRRESIELFRKAWLESFDAPELTVYFK